MPKRALTWTDYRLPTGREFSVAICGNTGKICHMFLGKDFIRRSFIREIEVDEQYCSSGGHCLALDCTLNKTPREHLMHMLDMHEDEVLDEDTAKVWGTESTVDSLIKFVQQVELMISEGKVTTEEKTTESKVTKEKASEGKVATEEKQVEK
jgi:hypothetical protein